ncbi:MAG: hypothetical protein ACKVQR_01265 [Aquabacterium sp.]
MSTDAFVRRAFPSRIADLGFAVDLPESWQPQDLPGEAPDFEDGTRLFGLGAAAAPYAAMVLAGAARPAFEDGTVQDWASWLIEQNGVDLRSVGPSTLGTRPAIVGQCAAASDIGEMLTHFAFLEDGQRLVHVSITGPAAMAPHVWEVWSRVQRTFELETPRGATTALAAPVEVHQPPPAADTAVADMGSFALPGGRATLEQDHPINQRLLEQGRGFAPNIRAADDADGKAWVASIALRAVLELPFGWHPLDDAQRLVLLHPDGSVQVSLERMAAPDGDLSALLDRIEAQARADYPAPQFLRLQSGPMLGMAVRGIHVGDEPLEQVHLLVAADTIGEAIRARVTAPPGQISKATDLGEALLYGVRFQGEDAPAPADVDDNRPAWARRAQALEAQGRLDEAEQAMRDGCDQIGVLMSIAVMYRERMVRLAAAGDVAGATDARARAVSWAQAYAGCATSGGEGAALSRERDTFVGGLGHK